MMRNTFRRADVIEHIAGRAPAGMRADAILSATDRFLQRDGVVELEGGRFSTTDLVAAERARERAQLDRIGERAVITPRWAMKVADEVPLNEGQRAVLEAVFTSRNGVDVVEAEAGTGKTFTANAIREVAEADGSRVLGCAPTAAAALELEAQAGIRSRTLDSFVGQLDRGTVILEGSDVIVADEMGTAGSRLAARLEEHARVSGAKLVEFQDYRQLAAVMAGGELRGVHEALGDLKLTEVVRQQDPAERRAWSRLHAGDVEHYLRHQEQNGRVSYGSTLENAVGEYQRAVREVGPERTALLVPTNALAREANSLARGDRTADEMRVAGLPMAVGDRVVCGRNEPRLQLINSDRGTVTRVRPDGIDIELDRGGFHRSIPEWYVEDGDLDYGHAMTTHKAQGATYDRTVVATHPDAFYRELAYVAMTRSRGSTELFVLGTDASRDAERAEIGPVDRPPAVEQRVELVRAMGTSRGEEVAIEQTPERQRERSVGLER